MAWAELDDDLMLIRLPGVFLAGEMIDWEAPTGGYLAPGIVRHGHPGRTRRIAALRDHFPERRSLDS